MTWKKDCEVWRQNFWAEIKRIPDGIPHGVACRHGIFFYCPGGYGGFPDGKFHGSLCGGGCGTDHPAQIHRIMHFIATNVSVSALVARRRGEQDKLGANQVLVMAVTFTVLAGALVSILCVTLADPIIRLCGASEDTQDSAALYFRIIMGGMLFNIISMVINAAQRGAGNTKIAMRTNVTSNVVNMIGNYLLIQGNCGFPELGIAGAAIATVFGTFVACIMSIASLFPRDNFVNIPYIVREKVRITLEPAKNMAKIASSVFLEQIFMRIGFLSVALMVARLGTDAFAAHQVGMNIMNLSFSFGDGMQVAAVALCGRSLGENRPDLAKMYGTICQRIGNMISLVLAVLYLLFGAWLYHLFSVRHISLPWAW